MINNDRLNAIVKHYKSQTFSFGESDAMLRAESIVSSINKYLKDDDKDSLLRYLSDHCPLGDYGFGISDKIDEYCLKNAGSPSYCEGCWEMVIGDKCEV